MSHANQSHQMMASGGSNGGGQEVESRIGLLISSFASLLSFAHSDGVQLPTGDTSRKLSMLLSRFGPSSQGSYDGKNLSSGTCVLPCLLLRSQASHSHRFQETSLKDVMAVNLSAQVVADRSVIDQVPMMLLQNTASSFEELISSRLRVSLQAIMRTMLKTGGEGNDARVLRKLLTTTAKPVKVTTVVTSYQLVNVDKSPGITEGQVVRPLVFETIVDLSLFGKMYTISLDAPGTISATLNSMDNLLDNVKLMLDTMSLLKTMMTQARAIVKKAIKRAANITTTVANYKQLKREQTQAPSDETSTSSSSSQQQSMTSSFPQQQSGTTSVTAQDELLASYPDHLRETVSHFLPEVEITEDINVEGFPPNLLQTLKSLSGGETSLTPTTEEDMNLPSNNNELHQGLFSWMSNDDMMLAQTSKPMMMMIQDNYTSSSSLKRSRQSTQDFSHPLKKTKKVSFVLPERH